MEIKGDDFLKKLQEEQEKIDRVQEHEEIKSSIKVEGADQELGNIMLDNTSSTEDAKKKYMILGLGLVILFLSVIIVFILSDDSTEKNDSFTSSKTVTNQKTSKEDVIIEKSFQKIMNERIQQDSQEQTTKEEPTIIEEKTIVEEKIKEIETQTKEKAEPVKIEKKPVAVSKPKPIATKSKGYFVQVGSFTKYPSKKYLDNVKNAGLSYIVHKAEVKGKLYNKVLVGPYTSRNKAKADITNIKKKLKLSSAYVLKL